MATPIPAAAARDDRLRLLIVAISLIVVSSLHYATPRDHEFHALHDVWRRLYYVPIVLGAFHFGLKGGLATSLAATLLYLPHVLFQWGGMAHGNQYLEIVMFNVIGLVTGLLAGELRRRRREASYAYEQLAGSFERAKEAERLAAMGQLSASLAHEIRNPLASLKGALPILLGELAADDERQEFAAIARHEIGRLEELTGQFLEYARPPEPQWAPDKLNDIVRGVAKLLDKEAQRHGVGIQLQLDEAMPLAPMDSNRMRQVLLNLALNGIQAMAGSGRGQLRLRSGFDAEHVWVRVEDEGPGVSPEAREHLFEPFFSTKDEGTGLGLAVVYQTMARHGGDVSVRDGDSGGGVFEMRIPRRRPSD